MELYLDGSYFNVSYLEVSYFELVRVSYLDPKGSVELYLVVDSLLYLEGRSPPSLE